jgi:hypothetical protein
MVGDWHIGQRKTCFILAAHDSANERYFMNQANTQSFNA